MPSSAGRRAALAGEEEDARRKQATWIQKRTLFSLCVKLALQYIDVISDVVTPGIYFYDRYYRNRADDQAAEAGATFLELTVSFLPEESYLLAVPSNITLRYSEETLVGNLAVPPAAG